MATPVSWITVGDLADQVAVANNPQLAADAVEAASFVLFHLSGRKYGGVRTTTEEYHQIGLDQIGLSSYYGPNRLPLPGDGGYPLMYPELRYGIITNRVGGICGGCGCTHLLRLRGGPVLSVASLKIGETTLDLADYDIYDYSFVAAPNRCWGLCDDATVTYTFGAQPPALGRIAAKAMADQYVMAMVGDEECALPQRVTQISRQGMSWTLLDPQDFLDKGRTGIYQVDLFLTTVNPDGARLRSRVFSPDMMRGKTRRSPVAPTQQMQVMTAGYSAPAPTPVLGAMPTLMSMQSAPSPTSTVIVDPGRPLRWVVPGSFTAESPPTVVVRPSGEEVPPGALSWRTGNFTLDLATDQVEQLLPPGSVLVVSSASSTGEASYPVERRTQ
jgi:hypothetical protein